jgi:hypothetical protein
MDPDAIDPVVRKYASELGLDRHPNSERSQSQSPCAIPCPRSVAAGCKCINVVIPAPLPAVPESPHVFFGTLLMLGPISGALASIELRN